MGAWVGSHPQPSRTVCDLTVKGFWSLGEESSLGENKVPCMDKGLRDFTMPEGEITGKLGKERDKEREEGEERGKEKERGRERF